MEQPLDAVRSTPSSETTHVTQCSHGGVWFQQEEHQQMADEHNRMNHSSIRPAVELHRMMPAFQRSTQAVEHIETSGSDRLLT